MAKPKLKLVSQSDEKLLLCFRSSFEGRRGAAWAGRKSGGLILVGVTLNMDERANTGQKVNARSSGGKKEGQKRDGSPWGNRGKKQRSAICKTDQTRMSNGGPNVDVNQGIF